MSVTPTPTVLLIDDDQFACVTMGDCLRDFGYNVLEARGGAEGLDIFARERPDAVLVDLRMKDIDGHQVLAAVKERSPDTPVLIISGAGDMQDVIRALRHGASDFLTKPLQDSALLDLALRRALDVQDMRREHRSLARGFLSEGPRHPEAFDAFVTVCPRILRIFAYCEAVAAGSEPVLITGETGVGKEILARAIHRVSGLPGPFVAVNVAGLDEHAFSDTLFGHTKGAFTGATGGREGMIEQAARGTLFLDEIGDLPQVAQIRLLRVLQEREYHPLGADRPRPMTARVLAATNIAPGKLLREERFRNDFYYRLATHSLAIPPLRERPEDIPPLVRHFLDQAEACFRKRVGPCPPDILGQLAAHPFPGNVRELRGTIFDAVVRSEPGRLSLSVFDTILRREPPQARRSSRYFVDATPLPTIRQATEELVQEALARSGGKQNAAARLLGITPQALNSRLRRRDA
ncbi:MAG: sigma-54-dependent Fis family transcriptional regulator [Desulfovibrionaceae bacterium]|nr:sigma-54-dependent Fis family transcriptional regulator [Desulfovibrionaceae bacterium]